MDAEYATRKRQWLAECQVAPEIFPQVMPRLATFMAPFGAPCCRQESSQHAQTYVCGLLADVARKNIASIAYRFGPDRLPLQRFIGWAAWNEAPLRQARTRQGAEPWGHADGVLVFDPSALAKAGAESVGVARQWCGRLDNIDPCHVALSLGDVSATEQSLWTCGGLCPKSGPTTKRVWTKPACPMIAEGIARGTRWRWIECRNEARRGRRGGSPAMTRWAARTGCATGSRHRPNGRGWRCLAPP
jgi:hypothetical protein